MGLFDRIEKGLERAVNGAFARAFKAEVQPVEIAAAMRRAMDDRAAILGKGRTIVPNLFTVELAPSDYERLTSYSDVLSDELVASAQEHAESQRYQPGGRIQVQFSSLADLETGVFRVRPSTAKVGRAASPPGSEPPAAGNDEPGGDVESEPYAEPSAAPAAAPRPTPRPTPRREMPERAARQPSAGGMPAGDMPVRANPGASPVNPGVVVPSASVAPPVPIPTATPSPIIERPDRAHAREHGREPQPQTPAPPHRPFVNPAERPWLDIDGEHYPLLSALTVLGRDDVADIVLDDPGISRRHTEIRVTTDGPHFVISIRDMGSTNGTFVNGERITSRHVQDGDQVTVGRTSMTLRVGRR